VAVVTQRQSSHIPAKFRDLNPGLPIKLYGASSSIGNWPPTMSS
jgi:hypothetical protein